MATKINAAVILRIAATGLLVLGVATAGGLTTIVLAQKILYNHFIAKLSGSNEVPPVATAAFGIAIFHTLHVGHQQVINYELHLKNIRGVTSAMVSCSRLIQA